MSYAAFHEFFPEIAEKETRIVTIFQSDKSHLPRGEYAFLEMFCDEPGCDCRRVFFFVMSSPKKNVEAVICYGWESPDFYAKWLHDDDPHTITELMGPALNIGSPQSSLAPAILKLVRDVLLRDPAYIGRIKEHYRMFREWIDSKASMS
jgi:hypothetical protein